VQREESPPLSPRMARKTRSADALLVEQMRQGDPAASRQFVREHYREALFCVHTCLELKQWYRYFPQAPLMARS
jgi:hypothetical protein